jgi:hypothetical protein
MIQDEGKNEAAKPVAADREPYRRLIDLQKQMIELVQRHERTKQECIALREQLLEEMDKARRWPWSWRPDTRWLKGFGMPGSSGWWWARNRTAPLFVPAKQPISTKPIRPGISGF